MANKTSGAPIVAIVGRSNVGKSSLFNRLVGFNQAIVARESGTTRDSVYGKVHWQDHDFWLVDTAGLKAPEDDFELTIQEQITEAMDSADLILVVAQADTIISDEDRKVAKLARQSKTPTLLVINKSDLLGRNDDITTFRRLGLEPMVPTSTTQSQGIEELLAEITSRLPKRTIREADDRLHIALLGRPNVGKSHLFNTLAKKQQAVVANVAGTTRDINRATIKYHNREIELLDTAGIRRSGKIEKGIEQFSVMRSLRAIEEADVCLLLMDVNELGVALDQKIAGMIKEAGKGLVLVVSKWDSAQKDAWTHDQLAARLQHDYQFVPWAPLIFTSAVSGQNVAKLLDLVTEIDERRHQTIKTTVLNRWLGQMIQKHPPAGLKNRHPKLNYMLQLTDEATPTFQVFGAHTANLHWSYKRYLERELRLVHDFAGTPIRLVFKEKHIDRKKK